MLSLEETVRFREHRGPFLAWGYRAAVYAVKKLKPASRKEIFCKTVVLLRTPYTCILDGIQAGSPCTLGKLNLQVVPGDEVKVVFESSKGRICLKPALDLERLLREKGEEGAFEDVIRRDDDELFTVE